MLARMECHRDSWIEREPLELLAEPQRGCETEGPALAVVQPDRRHGLDDDTPCRCAVAERNGQISGKQRFELVVPDNRHRKGDQIASPGTVSSRRKKSGTRAAKRVNGGLPTVGALVALKPRYSAYVVAAWLAGIIVNLLSYSG